MNKQQFIKEALKLIEKKLNQDIPEQFVNFRDIEQTIDGLHFYSTDTANNNVKNGMQIVINVYL